MDTHWKPVVDDFRRQNASRRPLRPLIPTESAYELVAAETKAVFAQKDEMMFGSKHFYDRWPHSGGLIRVSAVGFDRTKTRALVYMDHRCGALGASGSHPLLEKTDGVWKAATPKGLVNCHSAS